MTEKNLPVWDLSVIYPDTESWDADFQKITPAMEAFAAFKGHLADSPAKFKAAIEASDAADRLVEKLYTYANLLSDENTSDNRNRQRVERLEALLARLSPLESWFTPEVMAIPDDVMQKFLASEELAFYKPSIEELLREKPHVLSAPEEKLLGELSEAMGTGDKCFEILNDSDLTFGSITDENGKKTPLTHGNYIAFMESPDRRVRRRAFMGLYRRYQEFRNTFATTLDGAVRTHVVSSRLRHYPSALAAGLEGDEVPEKIYTDLIAAVRKNLPQLHDSLDLRRQIFGLKKLDMYDVYAPFVAQCRRKYTFAEAADLVKKAVAPLGKQYVRDLEQAFTQKWIHAPEQKGKRSGAYSGGCYDTYPYVLTNFHGELNDVFTLAHELGHSMHSFYSRTRQHYHYHSYHIFVAEVASTVNETLLFEYLLKNSTDQTEKNYLLGHFMDEIRGTVYRQTMFAEFELAIHREVESGNTLSADDLEKRYFELNKAYQGPAVRPHHYIGMEWARIPHFYYDFYVYKYATGMSAALSLVSDILGGKAGAVERYLNFLGAGDSKPVLQLLQDAGVDLSTPEPVNKALHYYGELTARLRKNLGFAR